MKITTYFFNTFFFKNISIKIFFSSLVIFFSLFSHYACDTTEPPTNNHTLILELEDVSSTEAWLQFTGTGLELPKTLTLYSDDKVNEIIELSTNDTLIYVDSLLPNKSYKVKAALNTNNNQQLVTNEVTFTTMDTTSQDYNWQEFMFGDPSSEASLIYDVAIINPNNIWAVGEIFLNDSLGQPQRYNAVHWNGKNWELKRIKYYGVCSAVEYPLLRNIWAFSDTNIILSNGGSIGWFNSKSIILDCRVNSLLTGAINKIWGITNNEVYAVGTNGNVVCYQNGNWEKLESTTTTNINDAWGVENENKTSIVYCPVSSIFNPPQDKKILKISNEKVDSVSWAKDKMLYSCWTDNNHYLYVCGSGAYSNRSGQWQQENLPAISMNMIRGNAKNDIFIIGDLGFAAHFNGVRWKVFNENFGNIYRLAVNKNLVSFVGQKNGYGYLVVGQKN